MKCKDEINAGKTSEHTALRMTFIDGLRAIAALLVLVAHSDAIWGNHSTAGPLSKGMLLLADKGALGVEVFFVVSGFSIAYATKGASFDLRWAKIFLLRRLVRLSPVYIFSLVFAIAVLCLQYNLGNAEAVEFPSFWGFVSHIFFAQELLGFGSVLIVYWTLCMEVQFYIAFAAIMLALQALENSQFQDQPFLKNYAFAGIAILSLTQPFAQELVHENFLFTSMWFMFAAGVLAWWVVEGRLPRLCGWCMVFVLFALGIAEASDSILVATLTCTSILICAFSSNLHRWLNWKWIQFLGIISYSLYVIHVPVSMFVKTAQARFLEFGDFFNLFAFSIMVMASVGSAYIVYRCVESPSIAWSRRLKKSSVLGA